MKLFNLLDQVPPAIRHLLDERFLAQYPCVLPNSEVERELKKISVDELVTPGSDDPELAQCALAGLWLLNGFLDQSHSISQSLSTPEGNFWHAIMHRLEGDFWNSKYWYRQVGKHAVYQVIGEHLQLPNGIWRPAEFVDQCEEANAQSSDTMIHTRLNAIAIAEWQALFQFCIRPQ